VPTINIMSTLEDTTSKLVTLFIRKFTLSLYNRNSYSLFKCVLAMQTILKDETYLISSHLVWKNQPFGKLRDEFRKTLLVCRMHSVLFLLATTTQLSL
jgi:hypothetical protein